MASTNKNSMRGLTVFITDVRNCPNKEVEEKRVNKEMAKIRKKFKEADGIVGYDRRKYVCKLLYMYMLGYDIDFGYMEAVALLSANKYQEKLVGYLALTILLHENHEMLPLIVQSLQNDLQSRNEFHQALALTAIANIGGKEMSESLAPIVQKLLMSKAVRPPIKKRASLTLLRLYRKYSDLLTPDVWAEKISLLLDEADQGLLTSVMSLLLGVATDNSAGYIGSVKKAIAILTKIVINRDYTKDYIYYNMANPWLQVKLLKFLSKYDPPEDRATRSKLYEILKKILSSADEAKGQTVNHKNALNAVLFEAIYLVIQLDDDRDLIRQATALLGRYISTKEHSNIRYLALEAMGHLASLDSETAGLVRKYQETVILALRDPDISIRKRALDLLYGMCDKNNANAIVSELLSYLATADFAIREELVLKIAILAEKFATKYSWYVDVILQLISLAGDSVSDDIWFRVVQIVTNHEDIQDYAARTVFQALQQPNVHETAVKVGGYILGEFGHFIADNPASSPRAQFESLHSKFASCSLQTKGLLFSTYAKFVNLWPELADLIRPIFKNYQTSLDAEVQQRACEYLRLATTSDDLMQAVWDVMPIFPEKASNKIGSNVSSEATQPSIRGSSGSLTGSKPNTPTISHKAPLPPNPLEDIFAPAPTPSSPIPPYNADHGGFLSSPASPFGQDSSVPVLQPQEITDIFKRGLLSPEGVLYQDASLQIGYKSEFSKSMGRMMLYYGNVSQQPLTDIRFNVTSPKYLTVSAQPFANAIDVRAQAQQMINVNCTSGSDFANHPLCQVSFNSGGRPVNITFRLPVSLTKFVEPMQTTGPVFFQQWNQLPNPPQSDQAIIKSSKPIDMGYLTRVLSTGFHFAVLQGVDPNVNNLVAAGTVNAGATTAMCLIRVESNQQAGMYRATIRSPSPQVTAGIKEMLTLELS